MNSSKWIWRITASVSFVITIVLIIGFIYAVKDINSSKSSAANGASSGAAEEKGGTAVDTPKSSEQETEPKDLKVLPPLPDKIKITAIGDSLAKGTGDSTGSGFVRRAIQNLNDSGRKSELLNNLAINGLTTEGLISKLEEKGVQYALKQADLILLSIGGNDLFQGSRLMENAKAGKEELDPKQLMNELPQATKRLTQILDQIRVVNPDARVIYVGLYHPFADIKELLLPGNVAVSTWNHAAQQVVNRDSNMVVVPTFDLFQGKLDVYLSSDHFHPNDKGYEAIADRIAQGIL
ncbi:GDSL-type esterase/lipase family protein [Paenibacillus dakarensis]|uniref:GDSL-type esterase/lipase family protein n=1 Tax=Paenibacillus dakarensis TaxID=1527293 RepID=UPI0006D5AE2E|nr:GDSL-type esterase/lipase family protein [Paenibacillus dakarensis]